MWMKRHRPATYQSSSSGDSGHTRKEVTTPVDGPTAVLALLGSTRIHQGSQEGHLIQPLIEELQHAGLRRFDLARHPRWGTHEESSIPPKEFPTRWSWQEVRRVTRKVEGHNIR